MFYCLVAYDWMIGVRQTPSGKVISNTYILDRLTSTNTQEGITNYTYLFADKIGTISTGSEKFIYTYDGTLLTTAQQAGILNQTLNYSYNNDFLVTSTTYAGQNTAYAYDNDGLLTQSGNYTLSRDVDNGYTTKVTDSILVQDRTYNNYGEITQVSDNTFSYNLTQRDNGGAVTQKQESINGTTSTYDYTYDNRARLIEVKKETQIVESYTYDANSNRASATVNGITTTASYTLDDNLEVYGDNTYLYDVDGYLVDKTTPNGSSIYTYNTLGSLTGVTKYDGTTIIYHQNALNQRVAKEVNGVITEKYLWADLTTLLAVYDGNDNLVQRFEYADNRMPISMTQNSQKYYLHYDQVGTLRAVSDINHNIVKEITYDTFGNILNDTNPTFKIPFGFAGGLHDRDTKLTRFGYRDYDSHTGKWTAKDPIGLNGGDTNLYGYVLNDPVDFVDSDGLWSVSADLYIGRGGGITMGNGSNGWFLEYRFGVGLAGGVAYNPLDNGMNFQGDGTYLGAYCEIGASFGNIQGSAGVAVGLSNGTNGSEPFFTQNSGISVSDYGFGAKIGGSAGVKGGMY